MNVTPEELGLLAIAAKPDLLEGGFSDEEELTIAVDDRDSFGSNPVTITEDGVVDVQEGRLSSSHEIRIAALFDEPKDGQMDALASVIAVLADAFEIEIDEAHILLPEEYDADGMLGRVGWLLASGLDQAE